jgi:hypothetical protein
MRHKNCERNGPSYIEVLQMKIAEQQYEYGITPSVLMRDYLIAKKMPDSGCPKCAMRLSKDTDVAISHLRHKHFDYFLIMSERLILKEIEYVTRHMTQWRQARYYDKLPVYFESPLMIRTESDELAIRQNSRPLK